MHKARIAEAILSLFTSRERAASTVGDWMEQNPALNPLWFWSRMARTSMSLLARDLAAAPFRLAGVAVRGGVANLAMSLLASFGLVAFFSAHHSAMASSIPVRGFGLVFNSVSLLAVLAVEFETGRWIARLGRGREIAACIVYLILKAIVFTCLGDIWPSHSGYITTLRGGRVISIVAPHLSGVEFMAGQFLFLTALFVGAIWVRRRPVMYA